jgi:calcineurin-like phosphoesterase family protein
MNDAYFTADLHLGHEKLLGLGNGRPFQSIEEHDEAIIDNWNARVAKGDRVYLLGDFSFGSRSQTNEYISRLRGQIHVVLGNHDRVLDRHAHRFASIQSYKTLALEGQKLVLFHFPILSWEGVGRGSWHLHGHCHNNLPAETVMARLDVGVDGHNFEPWNFEEIRQVLKDRDGLPGDHHGKKEKR